MRAAVIQYSRMAFMNHEARIGKKLKNFNAVFQHKSVKISYDKAMKRSKKLVAACLIFASCVLFAFAQNKPGGRESFPYRGKRMMEERTLFFVTEIESEHEKNNFAELEIKFNIPVDPRTVQKQHIRINGNPLPPEAIIAFNKAGTKIKILLPVEIIISRRGEQFFRIELPDAKSFNNMPLYQARFDDLRFNREYEFRFVGAPKNYPDELRDNRRGEYIN